MPDDQSNQTEQIMGAGYQSTNGSSSSAGGDPYSEILGQSGGNIVSRFARRALALKSGPGHASGAGAAAAA